MIRRIARKEVTELLRDGRFRWAGAVVLGLLLVTLATGWHHHRTVHAEHEAARELTRRHWLEQGEKNPHSAAHYGIYVFRPQQPLSFVDRGVDPYVGVATWLEAHYQNPFQGRPAQDATALARFGDLTAAGVLQLLVPLLIILLGFSAFTAERESGTLRQLLSLGVRPRDLGWGKVLGLAGGMAMLLVPAALVGAAALILAGGTAEGGDLAARTGLLALVYLLYFAVFLCVTLAVSARAPSSRVALVGLLGFWILTVLVAPRAASDLARRLHPTPSQAELTATVQREMEQGVDGHSPADVRLQALQRATLARYGARRIEDLPINFAGLSLQAGEEYGNIVYDRNYGGLDRTFERQEGVHRAVSLLAPMLAVRSLSMAVAGTDGAQHRHFAHAAEQHRRRIQRILNDDIVHNSRAGEEYLAGPELWERIPELAYRAPGVQWVMGRQQGSLAAVLLWALLSAGALYLATSPRRVRA